MTKKLESKGYSVKLVKGDITDLEIEAFVFYATHDLVLGTGFGSAISIRGGPGIQEELKQQAPLKTTEVVVSSAGDMKAQKIIHAVGPRFQEAGLDEKLKTTIINCLVAAEEKGIKQIAFPPMGAGFYGVPLEVSARITLETVFNYRSKAKGIEEVVVCLQDNREYTSFEAQFNKINNNGKESR